MMKNKVDTPKVKCLTKEEITNLPEVEFEKITRAKWNKWNNSVENSEDIIPYWEYYSEQCDYYKRKPVEG